MSILSFVQDVSSRIQAEERLQYLATRDALTGLPNRLLLQERLTQAIAQAKRSGRRVGVLFIDLDRFKNVNDTLGHRIGDELLKRVTAALSRALRETDLLARLGGDEFMVIVEDFDDPAVLNRIAQKLQDAIAQPFQIEEHDIYVTSSIGISVYPDDSDDPEELLKHADVAMYRSKELGRNTYQFFDADLARAAAEAAHAGELRCAPRSRTARSQLHYQPVVRIADRTIVGAEALLRWHDPEHGDVAPQVFIPLAEESGLIHVARRVGAAHRRRAVRRRGARRASRSTVSVNLSGRQFYRDDLAQRISDIVRERRLRAVVDRARGHRVEPAARPRRDPQGAAAVARRRLLGGDRRLRHRLLEPVAPEALPDRHAEDRHLVHRRSRDRPGRRGDHRGDHRARARPGSAGRRRRRRHAASSSTSSTRAAATASRASCSASRCRRTSSPSSPRSIASRSLHRAGAATAHRDAQVSLDASSHASSGSRRGLPVALQHQHVREPGHDRRCERRRATPSRWTSSGVEMRSSLAPSTNSRAGATGSPAVQPQRQIDQRARRFRRQMAHRLGQDLRRRRRR